MKNFLSDSVVANIENKKVPTISYFRLDHSLTPGCTAVLSEKLSCEFTLPSSWKELADEISRGIDHIAFHVDDLSVHHVSVKEFVDTIHTLNKTINGKILKIGAVITKKTTQQTVSELKNTGVHGILLDIKHFDIEDVCICSKNFVTAHGSCFPKFIIDQLPVEIKPISIYFRKDSKHYVQQIVSSKQHKKVCEILPWTFRLCETWDELSEALKLDPHQLIVHISIAQHEGVTIPEFISMIQTLMKVTINKHIPIGIAIDSSTTLSSVKDFQKSGIHGIVPSTESFGYDESYKGVEALFNRIPYWPKHILEQLLGAKKSVVKNTITLTPRQGQIVDLIKERGLSNKKIAQSLNITESTVKIHVSAILKAYGVRTRTQLVVVANK